MKQLPPLLVDALVAWGPALVLFAASFVYLLYGTGDY